MLNKELLLLDQARQWVADGATPAIRCDDLAAQMQVNPSVAYAAIAQLDLVQRTIQTVCYSAYRGISAERVLARWAAVGCGDTPGFMVYAIEHTPGIYIGKSTQPTWQRWGQHRCRLRSNRHHCVRLQCAWNTYGEQAFVFRVVQVLETEASLNRAEFGTIARYRTEGANVYNTR